ncbi:minor histocompatibility antigen H13 [Dermacentor andersoni]|uniref:minor histocompatibility antigen H13 n=1 Tax=Dermacentor andersoni TaxID=34620 RepID=UPI002154FACD|nr:minor histocompatibility antigen H13-like [Dermacentor andersoni]
MAGAADDVIAQVNETLKEAVKNETTKFQPTPAGQAVAYTSIMLMAFFPIVLGAFKSVTHQRKQKESGEKPETMTRKDAAMFPVIASGALFGLYIFFKLFSKEYINLLLTGYFFLLGVLALAHILSPAFSRVLRSLLPSHFYRWEYRISFQRWSTTQTDECEEYFDYRFSYDDIACWIFCCLFGVWYLWKKHWVANNLFGLAFAINGVELLHINTVSTGCTLLGGLFVYDIFWVFGTDVMVTVAKSFEAPIKLVFPQDFLESGFAGRHFAMLGLGDIVIPGIFIALLLRFDYSLKRQRNLYFVSSFVAYVLGLALTIFIMIYFNHAQPALLYLVPACIGVPLSVALVMGDITAMFKYEDHPAEEKASGTDERREHETESDSDQKTPKASPVSAKKNTRKDK